MAAKLGLHQQPAQSLGILGPELQALEGNGEAAPQVIDPHQLRARTVVVGHPDLPSPASSGRARYPTGPRCRLIAIEQGQVRTAERAG
jgi:hypothetical protein